MEPVGGGEASPSELRRALEWELSLAHTDLRSHAWYHGTIPRPRAEELMARDGDFLIRDCISRPGDYVLTCRWREAPLHFVINKVVFQPFTVYERIQYQFEDDCFDTVPDLVTYYVGNRRPISAASGAVVAQPVNRRMPLSYYATRYGLECQMHYAALALERVAGPQTPGAEDSHPSGASTLPRPGDYPRKSVPNFSTLQPHKRDGPTLKHRSSQESLPEAEDDAPPPKPSRVPSRRSGTTSCSAAAETSDSASSAHLYSELNFLDKPLDDNAAQLDIQDWPAIQALQLVGEDPSSFETNRGTLRAVNPSSSFELATFSTVLLQSENKPLDPQALAKMRCMLLEGGARIIAGHLTKVDLEVLRLSRPQDLGLGVLTGFELIVLPQGQQLRLDLLERTECLQFFVAVTVLTCGDEEVRAQVLNKWIQVAVETKTALGNLFGFTAIMMGLALPQICRLRCTWLKLRQTFTENAFTYETKLRPTLKSMQECSNPQAPNTCVPYLLSILLILQRHLDLLAEQDFWHESEEKPQLSPLESLSATNKERGKVVSLGLPWEQTAADYGLQLLLTHLEAGRALSQQWPAYRRNSEIVLENLKCDDLLLDAFRTEFHLRFLWGSRGCHVAAAERYSKFEQVLNVMSERCEAD